MANGDGGWGEVHDSFGEEMGREKNTKKDCNLRILMKGSIFPSESNENETKVTTSALRTVNGENGQIGAIVDVRFVVRSRFQGDCSL